MSPDVAGARTPNFTSTTVPAYQRVRRLQFVDVVPKTTSGKIRRADLRAAEVAAGTRRLPDEFRDDDPDVSAMSRLRYPSAPEPGSEPDQHPLGRDAARHAQTTDPGSTS